MNPDDIRAYQKRWVMVEKVEQEELTRMTAAQKFADLAMLMRVASTLGGSEDEDEAGVGQVRRRWNLLAERMGV